MSDKMSFLQTLGAVAVEHIDGNLIEHLKGTQKLLRDWGASTALQDAGLFHACYGTAGFSCNLASESDRQSIAQIIGQAAEELVYQYCACDRDDFFERIGRESPPLFKNRFTGETYNLDPDMLKNFCELTAANEAEIAEGNEPFMQKYGEELKALFTRMAPFLSPAASQHTREIFAHC